MSDQVKQLSTAPVEPVSAARTRGDGEHERHVLRSHTVNITIIVFAFLAVFWRVFFLGETIIDVRTFDNQLPWGYYAGEGSHYPYNRRDITDTYITRDYFVATSYEDGELPLWNPYTMAGHPIYADGVTR